jgi:hypothetical protein
LVGRPPARCCHRLAGAGDDAPTADTSTSSATVMAA